jgi:hypothetical protein
VQRIEKVERQLVPKCGSSPCRVALKWSRSLPDHRNFVDRDFEQELPNDGTVMSANYLLGGPPLLPESSLVGGLLWMEEFTSLV